MQTRMLSLALLAACVIAAPAALAAPAAQPAAPANPQMQVQHRSILDELDLTDAQQQQIKAAMLQDRQELLPLAKALDQRQAAFEQAQPGSSGYQSAVNTLAQAEADFTRTRVLHEGALRAKIYGLLTQAQRDKLQTLLAQQRARLQQLRAEQAQQAQPAASH